MKSRYTAGAIVPVTVDWGAILQAPRDALHHMPIPEPQDRRADKLLRSAASPASSSCEYGSTACRRRWLARHGSIGAASRQGS